MAVGRKLGTMKLHFTLDDADQDTIRFWRDVPKGQRSAVLARMTRWYSGAEGFGAVLDALKACQIESAQSTPAPPPTPTIDAQKATVDLLRKFGAFDDT